MELHILTSSLFRFIRMAIVINTFHETADAKGVQFETQKDKMVKTEFNYMDCDSASLLQCAVRCAGDRRCMSASYNCIHWSCHFPMHRINGADDQQKLDEGTSDTAMMKIASGSYWIGLNDIEEEGRFVWASDGLELDYYGWMEGEPTNASNEDCTVVQTASGRWYDVSCHREYHAICELN